MVDWQGLFHPTMHPLELVLRGSVMYLLILVMLRLLRREAGALGTADLLVIVLVADAAQNALGADYRSITEGAILVGTVFGWNWLLDWLGYRYRPIHRLIHPPPLELVRNGQVNRRNLRKEMLTMDDLDEQLREHGIESLKQVKRCYLEADGHLSVIKADASADAPPSTRPIVR